MDKILDDTEATPFHANKNESLTYVNIKCSLAFFSVVAQPFLFILAEGEEHIINNVEVKCALIKHMYDKDGSIC